MQFNEYLVKLIKTTRELENLDFFMGKAKLSKTEFRLMQEILVEREKGKGVISSELARRLGVTRSAISQVVTRLEERGIVKRVPSDTDKKIAYVELSEYTITLFEEQCARANVCIERVAAEFGEERLKNLIKENEELFAVFRKINAEKN